MTLVDGAYLRLLLNRLSECWLKKVPAPRVILLYVCRDEHCRIAPVQFKLNRKIGLFIFAEMDINIAKKENVRIDTI